MKSIELEAHKKIIDMFNKYANKPDDIGKFFEFCGADKIVEDALEELELLRKFVKEHLVIETKEQPELLPVGYSIWQQVECINCDEKFNKEAFDFIKEEIRKLEEK